MIVNLFGGPGSGKSTTAAGVFHKLKMAGISCELVTEYAKDKVWELSTNVLRNQPYILAKQYHRLWCLRNQVNVIITDSPVLLSLVYGVGESDEFRQFAWDLFNRSHNLNFFLERKKKFVQAGRVQNEERSREIDQEIWDVLTVRQVPFMLVDDFDSAVDIVTDRVLKELG